MNITKKGLPAIVCLFTVSVCAAYAQADSPALTDSGYLPGGGTGGPVSTVGWEFTPTCDIWVTQLGFFDMDQDGLHISHGVGIWDTNQQLLASATVSSGMAAALIGGYRYVSIAPTLLSGGQTFIIGATSPAPVTDPPGFEPDAYPSNSSSVDPSTIAFDSCITLLAANRYAESNTADMFELNFPDAYKLSDPIYEFPDGPQIGTIDYYFFAPNFRFVPEPSTLSLILFFLLIAKTRRCRLGRYTGLQTTRNETK